MIARLYRPFVMSLVLLSPIACASSEPTSAEQNAVDPTQHKINLSHQPIPEIGWPAMTMEFPVAPSIDLKGIKPGTRVNFTIEQGQGGMYEIKAIAPAGGGR